MAARFILEGGREVEQQAYFVQLLKKYKSVAGNHVSMEEIGDGNINYVYRVQEDGQSIIVKQAGEQVRSSGRGLTTNRLKVEYESLLFFKQHSPSLLPDLYEYDADQSIMVMEDLAGYITLRDALKAGQTEASHIDQLADFFVQGLLSSTSVLMDYQAKRRLEAKFSNADMCDISERLVFTYPFIEHATNRYSEQLAADVKAMQTDSAFMYEVTRLKQMFINNRESLIHGDLHSGSIFVKDTELKVLDSEFACFGPMSYDIGNVIAHLLLSRIAHDDSFELWINEQIVRMMHQFKQKASSYLQESNQEAWYNEAYMDAYLNQVVSDSYKYAGLEIVRRTVGVAKTAELDQIAENERANVEKQYLALGISLVINGQLNKS